MWISGTTRGCAVNARRRAATASPARWRSIRRQVAAINEAFTPTAEAIERAEAVIAAFADNPGAGTVGIGGVMYDRPHLERARQLLARVKR